MNLKISIIVPTYTVEKYINNCINSIRANKMNHLEILLVDDGSIDLSSEIIDYLSRLDSRITVIHKANGGLTSARQTGIIHATGNYLTIVDGDDWIDSDAISVLFDKLNDRPEFELVLFSHQKEYPDNSYPRQIFSKDSIFDNEKSVKENIYRRLFGLTNEELDRPLDMDYLSTCWGKLYRRDLALRAEFVNTAEVGSGEDGIFNIYALDACQKALYIDQPFYHYRYTAGSLTLQYRRCFSEQWKKLFSYMQNKIDEDHLSADFQEALNNRIALSVLGIGMNELDNPNGNFFQFSRYMKQYISSSDYLTAIKTMKFKKLPLPWKVLMLCCKCRFGFGTALILKAIRMIKNRL